jgi:branched-chain amino acid transport system ATP-binding protein
MSNLILELKNIHVSYGNIEALKGVDVTIKEGEIVCLIGANGAGKSTLLKSIVGLEPLTEGEVIFNGERITYTNGNSSGKKERVFHSTDKIISRGISMAPEGRGIFPEMTVLENLEMGAFMIKDKALIKKRIEEKYEMFEILKDRRKQLAGSLSGGEQQMLSIARALMSAPRLLLLDEPALGLAPIIIQNIFQTISKISREEKVTIFLVEQNAKMPSVYRTRGTFLKQETLFLKTQVKTCWRIRR